MIVNSNIRSNLMNKTIYIVDIEPLDNRYTKQWHYHIPRHMRKVLPDAKIVQITGDTKNYSKTTSGNFFDFSKTCDYKASQARKISQLFIDNIVQPNDVFFFTDAWNQSIHTVKYLSELNKIPVKTCGIWHAGYYDKTDILGLTIKNDNWARHMELSMFYAYDLNFFATGHHVDTFKSVYDIDKSRAILTGYPLDYISDLIDVDVKHKENIIVFPHRLNSDKAHHVFDWIAHKINVAYPDKYMFIKTQEHNLCKEEYYKLLSKAKVVFSSSKHENLGISMYEGVLHGCVPIVPDKLSYVEMYPSCYRYTLHDDMYDNEHTWVSVAEKILTVCNKYDLNTYKECINLGKHLTERYFTGVNMYHYIDRL